MFHNCKGHSHKTVSTDHNFWRKRRAEADSNRSPSAYKPNALLLGQTSSHVILNNALLLGQTSSHVILNNALLLGQTSWHVFLNNALLVGQTSSHVILNEWLAFSSALWISIYVLFGCYMAVATWICCCRGTFCVHHTTMHHFMSLHAKPHT